MTFNAEYEGKMSEKPSFYNMDIDNYNEEFLKKIIIWQSEMIQLFQEEYID